MQLPIDISELLKIATDLKEVKNTPLAVSIFVDDDADDALVGHVRAAFASADAHTKVTIAYLGSGALNVIHDDDMAVIIAGTSEDIGKCASEIRGKSVPVMVVTNMPDLVTDMAETFGYPIPPADICSPKPLKSSSPLLDSKIAKLVDVARRFLKKDGEAVEGVKTSTQTSSPAQDDDAAEDVIELNEVTYGYLDTRMGEWILEACSEKKLAFALAFPFVRKPLASDSVASTSLQNAAIGFVPLIPGADLPIMTLNQAKMVLQIATAYGEALDTARIKEIAAVVAGGFVFRNIARSVAKLVPFAGWVVSGAVGFLGTEAMGKAAIEYFEAGGDIVGVAKVVQTARDDAADAVKKAAATPAGKKILDVAKQKAKGVIPGFGNN